MLTRQHQEAGTKSRPTVKKKSTIRPEKRLFLEESGQKGKDEEEEEEEKKEKEEEKKKKRRTKKKNKEEERRRRRRRNGVNLLPQAQQHQQPLQHQDGLRSESPHEHQKRNNRQLWTRRQGRHHLRCDMDGVRECEREREMRAVSDCV